MTLKCDDTSYSFTVVASILFNYDIEDIVFVVMTKRGFALRETRGVHDSMIRN